MKLPPSTLILASLIATLMWTPGCASEKPILKRGWIGGTFASAHPDRAVFLHQDTGKLVRGFPAGLPEAYQGGVLVTDLPEGTPLRRAGAQEGDLILAADDKPISKVNALRTTVEGIQPGTPLKLRVWRHNQLLDVTPVIGEERYQKWHYFQIGLALSPNLTFDLLPNPNFSLVVLGFKRRSEQIDLRDPEVAYRREVAALNSKKADRSEGDERIAGSFPRDEGWDAWLACFTVGAKQTVLSQEPAAPPQGSARP